MDKQKRGFWNLATGLFLIILEKSSAILKDSTINKLLILGCFFQVLGFSGSDLHDYKYPAPEMVTSLALLSIEAVSHFHEHVKSFYTGKDTV